MFCFLWFNYQCDTCCCCCCCKDVCYLHQPVRRKWKLSLELRRGWDNLGREHRESTSPTLPSCRLQLQLRLRRRWRCYHSWRWEQRRWHHLHPEFRLRRKREVVPLDVRCGRTVVAAVVVGQVDVRWNHRCSGRGPGDRGREDRRQECRQRQKLEWKE